MATASGTAGTPSPYHVGFIGVDVGLSGKDNKGKGGHAAQAQSHQGHQGKGIGGLTAPKELYEAWNFAEEEQVRAQIGSGFKGKGGYKGKGGKVTNKGKSGKAGKGKGTGSTPTERMGDWSCTCCGFENFSWRWQCWSCREPNMAAFEPMNYEGSRPMFFPARNPPQGNHGPGARYPGSQYPGIAGQIRHLPEFEQNQGQPQNSAQTAWVKGGWKNRETGGHKDQH